jgi:hypothetical protein
MTCSNCGSEEIEWREKPTEIGPGSFRWDYEPECQKCHAHGDDIDPEEYFNP